jgi:hypothetical protein
VDPPYPEESPAVVEAEVVGHADLPEEIPPPENPLSPDDTVPPEDTLPLEDTLPPAGTPPPESKIPVLSSPDNPPADLPALARAVQLIQEMHIFGGTKNQEIRGLTGDQFTFRLRVKENQRSFGAFSDPEFKNGRSVTGTLVGSDVEVVILFPGARNEEVQGWEPGSEHEVRGEVMKWDRLRERPELKALG